VDIPSDLMVELHSRKFHSNSWLLPSKFRTIFGSSLSSVLSPKYEVACLAARSVTSRTSLTSRRANQLATCKRQTGAGCSLLPRVRLGPPCRRPILIATNTSYFGDRSLLVACCLHFRMRPGEGSQSNRILIPGNLAEAIQSQQIKRRSTTGFGGTVNVPTFAEHVG
jgi:hypothetical protein